MQKNKVKPHSNKSQLNGNYLFYPKQEKKHIREEKNKIIFTNCQEKVAAFQKFYTHGNYSSKFYV